MTPILECRDLSKRYGSVQALTGLNLTLEPGKIVGLLGPNGSGKTTLIKMANGLLTWESGSLLIDGNAPGRETRKVVSYLPERTYLPEWMSARQTMNFFEDFYGDFRRERAEDMLDRLNIPRDQKIRAMSKGTREKVQLILVMSRAAKLYLLDEPIGGVDPATRDYILATIIGNYDPGATVLISTHLISDVEQVLDEAVFINQGQIVMHKAVDEIRQEYGKTVDQMFREVFRC